MTTLIACFETASCKNRIQFLRQLLFILTLLQLIHDDFNMNSGTTF